MYKGLIPFSTKDGSQLHYVSTWELTKGLVKMEPNSEFLDTLTFTGFCRGRSAAYAEFVCHQTGAGVIVFLHDFEPMIPLMHQGRITGKFTFCKRGKNYGCQLAK